MPTVITAEASHWFYRNYYAKPQQQQKREEDGGLPIEMLQRWSSLLPWNIEALLQQQRFTRLRAMACMHLWTGLLFSLFLRACALPLLLYFVVVNKNDFEFVVVLVPVTYCLSLSVGKLLLPGKRWHIMFAKYEGTFVVVPPSSSRVSSLSGKRSGARSSMTHEHDDGGSVGDVDEDVAIEETSTESSGGESTYSGEVVSSGSGNVTGGNATDGNATVGSEDHNDTSLLRTPKKNKGNHHLHRLQVSPSSGGRRNYDVDYAVKNDDPESEDQASASESESLQKLLPASSPLLKRLKHVNGKNNTHERLNPGTPRGAGGRRRVGSYYS